MIDCARCGEATPLRGLCASCAVAEARVAAAIARGHADGHDPQAPRHTPFGAAAVAELRAAIGSTATGATYELWDLLFIAERVLRLEADPVGPIEHRIATATLAELDALNEKLEALGVRMVERAAELRRALKG